MPLNVLCSWYRWFWQDADLSAVAKSEMIRIILLMLDVTVVFTVVDFSGCYHYIRSQSFMKLYVFFNMLEIFERLMRSLGNDLFDVLMGESVASTTWERAAAEGAGGGEKR